MAKIQSVEPNIADLANGWLKSYKRDYKLEQESLNTEIDQALNDYYCFDAKKVAIIENRGHPYIVRQSTENGRKGNIDEPIKYLNPGNTISFGQDTATMFYQEKPYFTGDKIKILRPKYAKFGKNNAQFFLSTMRKAFCSFAWGSSRFNVETLKKQMLMYSPRKLNVYVFPFSATHVRT